MLMSFSRTAMAAALAVALITLAGTAQAVTLKIATVSPDGSVWMQALRSADAQVREATDGRVKLKFYPGGVMGDDKAVLRKIRVGQLHGAVLTSGGLTAVDPDVQLYGLPLVLQSPEETTAIRAQFDQRLMQGLEENGFVSFGFAEVGFAYAMAQEPVTSVAGAREQKVWVPDNDPGSVRLLQGFGISGIPLTIADVLTGLQTGLINAIASPPIGTVALQWHTQLQHGLDLPLTYTYGALAVSQRQFKKVSPEDQATVRRVLGEMVSKVDADARRDHINAKAALTNQGIQWHPASAEELAEWQSLADAANEAFVQEGFIDATLYRDFQQAISALRADG